MTGPGYHRLTDLDTDTLITALANTRHASRSSRSTISRLTFDRLQTKARTIETILYQRGLSLDTIKEIR